MSIQISSPPERKHLALVNPYVGIRIVRTVVRPHSYRNQSGIFRIDYDPTQLTLLYLSYSFDKRFKHLIDDLRLVCV